ncbi:MAG: GlxA family transcriptional regulator, partial [Tardiphaga sp.]
MPKTPRFPPNADAPVRAIEMLAFPSVQLLDVSGPLQVFATANELARKAGGAAPYAPRVVSKGGRPVTASAGLELATAPLPSLRTPLDTLLIAGGPGVHAAA